MHYQLLFHVACSVILLLHNLPISNLFGAGNPGGHAGDDAVLSSFAKANAVSLPVYLCGLRLQCLPPAGTSSSSSSGSTARLLLLREAMLACHAHNCSSTLERLLQLSAAGSSGNPQEQQWLQVQSTKLQLQPLRNAAAPAAAAAAAGHTVEAHLQVLQHDLEALQAAQNTSSSSSNLGGPGDSANAAGLAAAYLSLGSVLQQAAQHTRWQEVQSLCPALTQVDWLSVASGAGQALSELSASTGMFSTVGSTSVMQEQPQQLAVLACTAAAVASQPQQPVPWKAYGDLLFGLAGGSAPNTAGAGTDAAADAASESLQQGLDDAEMFAAAAEAFCQHLVACANTGALTSPQNCLGVLLKLLQIILQHGEQLQDKLSAALAACPAAVWQVLTNQLLAQLQHRNQAVRALIQQLLQGLAVVVPCAVLYPLVVEVRTAQETGSQVGLCYEVLAYTVCMPCQRHSKHGGCCPGTAAKHTSIHTAYSRSIV